MFWFLGCSLEIRRSESHDKRNSFLPFQCLHAFGWFRKQNLLDQRKRVWGFLNVQSRRYRSMFRLDLSRRFCSRQQPVRPSWHWESIYLSKSRESFSRILEIDMLKLGSLVKKYYHLGIVVKIYQEYGNQKYDVQWFKFERMNGYREDELEALTWFRLEPWLKQRG